MKQYALNLSDIEARINQLTDEDRRMYPAHYYDSVRIRIAQDLAIKEYYKLYPFMTEAQFDQLENTMLDWFVGIDYELAPVHDYWNIVGSFTETCKLKELIFYLTSSNIVWELEEIDSRALVLRWGVGDLAEGEVKTGSWTYQDIQDSVLGNSERFVAHMNNSDEHSASSAISRDHFPIIVTKDSDGNYTLLDGNRRTMRAWLNGSNNILAWVGKVVSVPALKDFWVSPSFLRRLLAEYVIANDERIMQSIHSQLEILFEQSTVARYHYVKRCLHMPGALQAARGLIDEQ